MNKGMLLPKIGTVASSWAPSLTHAGRSQLACFKLPYREAYVARNGCLQPTASKKVSVEMASPPLKAWASMTQVYAW